MTLIEVLLVLIILGIIATAIIVNFDTMKNSQCLEEGTSRVESLIKMVKAKSALSGKVFRLRIEKQQILIEWESYPNLSPNEFRKYNSLDIDTATTNIKVIECNVEDRLKSDVQMIYFYPDGKCDIFDLKLNCINDKRTIKIKVDMIGNITTEIE